MYRHTRAKFTKTDHEFIAETLARSSGERSAILEMANDEEAVTDLLHHKRLFEQSMTTPPMFLSISPHLFFYVFVYQALEYKHMADDDVADYVAGICVEFRESRTLWQLATTEGGKTVYFVDLLNMLGDVDKHRQYFLRRYIGNVSL